jgi:hypothetical protein
MNWTLQSWLRAVWQSILTPANVASRILPIQTRPGVLWTVLALVVVLNVLLLALMQAVSPTELVIDGQAIVLSPFNYTAIVACFMLLFISAVSQIGRALGGQGSFHTTMVVMLWLQAVSLTLEVGQVLLVLISQPVAAIYSIISLGALIWCLVNFTMVLHEFAGPGRAILTLALSLMGAVIGTSLLMAMMGVATPGGII